MNHHSIFIVLEAYVFPAADINLIRRMYCGFFLSIIFSGRQARSFAQDAPPGPLFFIMIFYQFPTLIRALQQGCIVEALENLNTSGSRSFADDMALHSDGPDAIPAMRVMVNAGPLLVWISYIGWASSSISINPTCTLSISQNGSLWLVLWLLIALSFIARSS